MMLQQGENVEYSGLIYLCKHMKYEKFNPEDVIIEQGEVTNGKMYLVYSGELNVLTKNLDWYTKQNLAMHGGGNEEHFHTAPSEKKDDAI